MTIRGLRLLALGGLLSVAIGSPALARQNNWMACDGYGAASGGGDGMSEYATVLLIFNPPGYGTTARSGTAQGVAAVAGCEAALSQLAEKHWRRRVNLLQARALHRVEGGDARGALQDLDLADAAGAQGDRLFDRSQRVGLMLSRAFVLSRLERGDEAASLLDAAGQARPYERGVSTAAASLAGFAGETPAFLEAQERLARLEPRYRAQIAFRLFDEGRFADLIALHPYLTAPQTYPKLGELPVEAALRELKDRETSAQFHAMTGAMRAYALTTLGRYDEADQAMAVARADLRAGGLAPPAPNLRGAALEQYTRLLAASQRRIAEGEKSIDEMAEAIARRRLVAEGRSEDVIETLDQNPLIADGTGADTLLAIAETLPPEQAAEAQAVAAGLRARLAEARKPKTDLDLTVLFDTLPSAETPGRMARWREAKRPFLAMRGSMADSSAEGYRDNVGPDGLVTVRFRGGTTPQAQVEEMALLRAAELARQGGHKGFVMIDRRDTSWSISTTQYGVPLRSDPAGFETEIDVRFVDPAGGEAPAALVFDADQVYADLAAVYVTSPPAGR